MSCEAEKELKLVGAKLTEIAGALMSRDDDPGELTPLQLLAVIESKLKDRGPGVMELYTRSVFVRRRLEGVLMAARNAYELAPSQEAGIKELGLALGLCDAQALEPLPEGGVMIMTERLRQILVEGWPADIDDSYVNQELMRAAIAYLMICDQEGAGEEALSVWPWPQEWFKPNDESGAVNVVRNLVKAGALIAAEIDRLLRLKATEADAATDGKEGN